MSLCCFESYYLSTPRRTMLHSGFRITLVILSACMFCHALGIADDTPVQNKPTGDANELAESADSDLLKKAKEGWTSLRRITNSSCFTGTIENIDLDSKGNESSHRKSRIRYSAMGGDGRRRLLQIDTPEATGKKANSVYVNNDDNMFVLRRRSESDRWYVEFAGSQTDGTNQFKYNFLTIDSAWSADAPWRIHDIDLTSLDSENGFRVSSTRSLGDGAPHLIAIVVEQKGVIAANDEKRPPTPIRGGEIQVDPDSYWGIVRAVIDVAYGVLEVNVTYGEAIDGPKPFRPIKKIEWLIKYGTASSDPGAMKRYTVEIDHYQIDCAHERDFMLSSFELPDNIQLGSQAVGVKSRTPWLLFALNVAAVVVIVFLRRWYSQKD